MALIGADVDFGRLGIRPPFERTSSEINNELPVLHVEREAATCLADLRQRRVLGRFPTPVQAISEDMLALCRKLILWPPEADDVVVHLAITGNLDQHDRALAPVPQRLYPQTGPF